MKRIIVTLISIMMLFSAALCSEAIVYAAPSPIIVAATRQSVKTGWKKEGGKWYYYNTSGTKLKYLNKINGKYYYFNGAGVMQTGWITFKEGKRYFNSDGSMAVGWKTINKRQYFFKSGGLMAVYTNTIDGKTYYFNGSGVMQKGWLKFNNGKWRYYNSNGVMATGWQTLNAKKYYFGYDGYMYTYTNKIGSNTYYFNSKGVMHTGWLSFNNGKKRYYNSNGVMLTGWQTINNKKYYFESDGYMRTETLKDEANNIQYIFNSDGSLNRTSQLYLPEGSNDREAEQIVFNGVNDTEANKEKFASLIRDSFLEHKNAKFTIYSKKGDVSVNKYVSDVSNLAISEEYATTSLSGDFLFWNLKSSSFTIDEYSYYGDIKEYFVCFEAEFKTTYAQDNEFVSEVKKIIDKSGIRNSSRYEQVKYIYEYICANVNYSSTTQGDLVHTAYSALIKKNAVCQGYSSLFYCMCKELNIPARIIVSVKFDHAWNIVQMDDGLWYNIDCTYGAPLRAGSVKYFLAGTDERDIWIQKKENMDPDYETTSFKQSHPMSPIAYAAK